MRKGQPDELIYADDIAILAAPEEELQEKILSWQDELERKGLKVNSRKTEVMVSAKSGDKIMQVKDWNDEGDKASGEVLLPGLSCGFKRRGI